MTLTGGVKLEGILNLPGTLSLSPGLVAQLTGGKAKVAQAVPVKLRIVGPVSSPSVTDLEFGEAVASIGKGALAGALGGAVGGQLGKLLGTGDKTPDQAVDQKRAEGEAAAKAEAAKAQQKLEDAAKNQLKGLFGR